MERIYDKLTSLATAIRSKTGKTNKLSLDAMRIEIESLSSGGVTPTVAWEITDDGELMIYDASVVEVNYAYKDNKAPWYDSRVSVYSVIFKTDVTSIGNNAFHGCSNLTSIMIPGGVTDIGDSAFFYCTSLEEINFAGTTEQWNKITLGPDWNKNVPATYVTCSNGICNEPDPDYSEECQHSWIDATCTEPKTCEDCGATEGKALGHDMITGGDPGCLDEVVEYCQREGCEYYETYPARGHSYSYEDITVEPTCVDWGYTYTLGTCDCGETIEVEGTWDDIEPTGVHNFVDGVCDDCGEPDPDYEEDTGGNDGGDEGTTTDPVTPPGGNDGGDEGTTTDPVTPPGGSTGSGCVFAGTQIALDENTGVDIVDFVGGTPIDFCNPSTLEHSTQQTLVRFFYTKATEKVTLTLEDDKTIDLTPNHAILTEEGLKVYLDGHTLPKYSIGERVATVDGYKELVNIQEETVNETTVYNIATENSLMVANGIIVAGELDYNIDPSAVDIGGGSDFEKTGPR